MNNKDIRYLNCRYLVTRRTGGLVDMANKLQKEQSQVSQFAGKTRRKNVGDMIATQIENAYSLPVGWMDQPHPDEWRRASLEFDLPTEPIKVGEKLAEYMVPLAAWDDDTPLDDDEVARPCFTEVEASAGAGKTLVQENHGPKIRFSRYTLRKCGVDEHNAYGIRVKGVSMQPVLPDGSTIGIDVGCTRIIDGKTYAIDHSGMLRVKMLYRLPGNKVRLKSHNPEYQDEIISLDTEPEFKIIGRMFWHSALDYL